MAFLQVKTFSQSPGTAAQSATFDNPIQSGSLLYVATSWGDGGQGVITGVQDNLGNVLAEIVGCRSSDPVNGQYMTNFWGRTVTPGTSTVTVTLNAAYPFPRLIIAEYSQALALDQSFSNFQPSAPSGSNGVTVGPVTTPLQELVIVCAEDTNEGNTWTAGTGFTLRAQVAGTGLALEDALLPAGLLNGTFTNNNASRVESSLATFVQVTGQTPHITSPMGG